MIWLCCRSKHSGDGAAAGAFLPRRGVLLLHVLRDARTAAVCALSEGGDERVCGVDGRRVRGGDAPPASVGPRRLQGGPAHGPPALQASISSARLIFTLTLLFLVVIVFVDVVTVARALPPGADPRRWRRLAPPGGPLVVDCVFSATGCATRQDTFVAPLFDSCHYELSLDRQTPFARLWS